MVTGKLPVITINLPTAACGLPVTVIVSSTVTRERAMAMIGLLIVTGSLFVIMLGLTIVIGGLHVTKFGAKAITEERKATTFFLQ